MSRFVEGVVANAGRARTGMVTGEPGQPVRRSWNDLHDHARRIAGGLIASGLRPGRAVAVLAGLPAEIAPVAQGVWLAGGSMTMLHQPTPRTDLAVWRDDTLRVLRMIGAQSVVVGAPFDQMAPALDAYGIRHFSPAELSAAPPADPVPVDDDSPALLQLTSGSTAEPKAVRITHRNLYANLSDAGEHLSCGEDGVMVSWLPMFHDMGMIGCLALPMLSGLELVSVTPADFLGRPLLWAELLSRYGGTITTAPNFAWAVLARQLARVEPGQLDLSKLRVACNGAEPIDPATMRSFVQVASRFGFDPGAVNCCYGAAESTLVISMSGVADPMQLDHVDAAALERDNLATPAPSAGTDAEPAVRDIPMLGRPFPSVEVRVVDDEGKPLGDRQVGRLQLRGESVSDGYLTPDGWEPARDADGWLDIGDEGYVADGQIVVCGRRKDVIIMGGRNIYPTDIERAAATVPGVREGNVAAVRLLAGDGVARESFAVLAESRQAGDEAAAAQMAREVTARVVSEIDARPATVRILPPGSLPKTPSGKLRRAAARALLAGQ
ncbi:fatty acyl-AMP ligase [Paractinoplanes hotanensis]|uniref:Fatty acyl-AMP ligase n=1 Tax=Paractinoplanes hotanensis TaxID=2906497 RepID=A0ABT0XSA8_9ACTN|nr:fatty acyl-AMP ligase [Actinoplanes hotanensis]MCM4076128.1 fatty acyl-AMP ligase [Actinoplanes hotanensis]